MITATGCEALGRNLFDLREFALRQLDLGRRSVFFKVGAALGTGDRDHVFSLREHPRERELARRDSLLLRNRFDLIDNLEILLDIFALDAVRETPPHIVSRELAKIA